MAKLRILTVFALFFGAFGISTAETLDMGIHEFRRLLRV
jgi:predicted MFS family arabinose efflux permease